MSAAAREEALWALAECLFEAEDRLDPVGEEWSGLSEIDRSFYYHAINSVMNHHLLVKAALEIDDAASRSEAPN